MRHHPKFGFKFRNTDLSNHTNDDEVCIRILSSIILAVLRVQVAYTKQFHDFLIELGTQLLYARRMKNKSMWTVHNSFGRWWALRVHTMVHFDMNWSGDNLLAAFSLQRASLDTITDFLIKLGIKPTIVYKHFYTK